MATDPFPNTGSTTISPAISMVAITPNDSADLAKVVRMIYVGGAGNVVVIDTVGNTVTHVGVAAGSYIGPFRVARVNATSTTATSLIGYV